MHPADTLPPIEPGWFVPWIPYLPQGTFKPIHLEPNPSPQDSFSLILKLPSGVGDLGFPDAIGYFLITCSFSLSIKDKLFLSTSIKIVNFDLLILLCVFK